MEVIDKLLLGIYLELYGLFIDISLLRVENLQEIGRVLLCVNIGLYEDSVGGRY